MERGVERAIVIPSGLPAFSAPLYSLTTGASTTNRFGCCIANHVGTGKTFTIYDVRFRIFTIGPGSNARNDIIIMKVGFTSGSPNYAGMSPVAPQRINRVPGASVAQCKVNSSVGSMFQYATVFGGGITTLSTYYVSNNRLATASRKTREQRVYNRPVTLSPGQALTFGTSLGQNTMGFCGWYKWTEE